MNGIFQTGMMLLQILANCGLLIHSFSSHRSYCFSACCTGGNSQPYTLPISSPRRRVMRSISSCEAVPRYPAFFSAGNMEKKIRDYCAATGQPIPETPGQTARCIYESLALKNNAYSATEQAFILGLLTSQSPDTERVTVSGDTTN